MHAEEPRGKHVNSMSHVGNSSILVAAQALAVRVTMLKAMWCICIHSLVSIFIMKPQNP